MNYLLTLIPSKKWLLHFTFWSILFIYFYMHSAAQSSKALIFIFNCSFISSFILTYYFIYFFVFPYSDKVNYPKVFIGLLFSYFVFLAIEVINFKILFPSLAIVTPRVHFSNIEFIKKNFSWYYQLLIVAYSNLLARIGLAKAKEYNKRKEGRLNIELGMLKDQFHSHLNMNFLSYCYNKMRSFSELTAESIEFYTEMLKYTLLAKDMQTVKISDEVAYINNFMELQARLTDTIFHYFDTDIDSEKYKISPMLLGVLVEYAYKYGMIANSENPIEFQLKIDGNQLEFKVFFIRKISSSTLDVSLFKQLDNYLNLYYLEKYKLFRNLSSNICRIELNIDLNGTY
jgi:hypothetical protein